MAREAKMAAAVKEVKYMVVVVMLGLFVEMEG